MELVKETYLENTLSGHNKFYRVRVYKITPQEASDIGYSSEQRFLVRAAWGKIGTTGTEQVKAIEGAQPKAEAKAHKLVLDKQARGYKARKSFALTTSKTPSSEQPQQPDRFSQLEL